MKIRLDVSSESSARQRIHLKNQTLFSWKDKSKKLKCRLLQFLFGALRVSAVSILWSYTMANFWGHYGLKYCKLAGLSGNNYYFILFCPITLQSGKVVGAPQMT